MTAPWKAYKFTFEIQRQLSAQSNIPPTTLVLRGIYVKPAMDRAEEIRDALMPPYNQGEVVLVAIEEIDSL